MNTILLAMVIVKIEALTKKKQQREQQQKA